MIHFASERFSPTVFVISQVTVPSLSTNKNWNYYLILKSTKRKKDMLVCKIKPDWLDEVTQILHDKKSSSWYSHFNLIRTYTLLVLKHVIEELLWSRCYLLHHVEHLINVCVWVLKETTTTVSWLSLLPKLNDRLEQISKRSTHERNS